MKTSLLDALMLTVILLLLTACGYFLFMFDNSSPPKPLGVFQVRIPNGQVWYTDGETIHHGLNCISFVSVAGDSVYVSGDFVIVSTRPEDKGQIEYQRSGGAHYPTPEKK